MPKWNEWYDGLPQHTKEFLKDQPIWRDSDLFKWMGLSFLLGLVIGFLLG